MQFRLEPLYDSYIVSESQLNYGASPELDLYWLSNTEHSKLLFYFDVEKIKNVLGNELYTQLITNLTSSSSENTEIRLGLKVLEQSNFNNTPAIPFNVYLLGQAWRPGNGVGTINDAIPVNWEYRQGNEKWRYYDSGTNNIPVTTVIDVRNYPNALLTIRNGIIQYSETVGSVLHNFQCELPNPFTIEIPAGISDLLFNHTVTLSKAIPKDILFVQSSKIIPNLGPDVEFTSDKILRIVPETQKIKILDITTLNEDLIIDYVDVKEIVFEVGCKLYNTNKPFYGIWDFVNNIVFEFTRQLQLRNVTCNNTSNILLTLGKYVTSAGVLEETLIDFYQKPRIYFSGIVNYELQLPIAEKGYSIIDYPGGAYLPASNNKTTFSYTTLRTDSIVDESMLFIDVKDVMMDILLGRVKNYGIIVSITPNIPVRIKFYSKDTNTIFKPFISIRLNLNSRISILPAGYSYIEKTPGNDEVILCDIPSKVYVNEIISLFVNVVSKRIKEIGYEKNYLFQVNEQEQFVQNNKIPYLLKVSIVRKDNPRFIVLNDDIVEYPFLEDITVSSRLRTLGKVTISFSDFPTGSYQFVFKLYYPSGEKKIIYSNPIEVIE